MFANFTEETAIDSGGVLTLAGITTGMIPFSASFTDDDLVAYVAEDATQKVAGIGTYNSAADTITRNDTWNYNGTVVDKNPSANIALSGTVTVRCEAVAASLVNSASFTVTEMSSPSMAVPDNWISCDDRNGDVGSADAVIYVPVFYESPVVINQLQIKVSIASETEIVQIGICTCSLEGLPDKVIAIASADVTATGVVNTSLESDIRLEAGRYFTFSSSKDITAKMWIADSFTHAMRSGSYVYRNGRNGPLISSGGAVGGVITLPLVIPTGSTDPNKSVMVLPRFA